MGDAAMGRGVEVGGRLEAEGPEGPGRSEDEGRDGQLQEMEMTGPGVAGTGCVSLLESGRWSTEGDRWSLAYKCGRVPVYGMRAAMTEGGWGECN